MFEGLPLKYDDPSTGESELVTAFFTLSLVDEQAEAEAEAASEGGGSFPYADEPGFRFGLGRHPSADSKRWWRQKSREAGFVEDVGGGGGGRRQSASQSPPGSPGGMWADGQGSPVQNRARAGSGSYGEIEV